MRISDWSSDVCSSDLIAELFQVTPQAVTQHIRAIYEDGELEEAATCNDYLQVRTEGKREVSRRIAHYNLPVIVAVGFRVRSPRGSQFRRWAAASLSAYLLPGCVMADPRPKDPAAGSRSEQPRGRKGC